ncbi:MAG: NAD(P)/FAD-dependent oxidoreductase [Halobacteriovoraceae bacterium]|nr:NAD(P)/FAD-dependent oxidoreductase [Halobacteriovoraceae bacterium]
MKIVGQKKILIIGGGYGGLSLAALLATHGYQVNLYEAHTYLGGCASFFKRGKFKFDCGATTLSGLNPNRPLNILLKNINATIESTHLKTPMKIKLQSGKEITRYSDLSKFIPELEEKFPNLKHGSFWTSLKNKEERLWNILGASQYFPPKNISDFLNLLEPGTVKNADLGVYALTPLEKLTSNNLLENEEYKDFLNEQLIISTQSHINEVPTLIGAMGLIYPEDMHYSFGGISQLAYKLKEIIEKSGGKVLTRHKVENVEYKNKMFTISGMAPAGKEFTESAEIVVSGLTVWDTPKLFNKSLKSKFEKENNLNSENSTRGAWGAITATFAVKTEVPVDPLYHQVHINNQTFGKGSLFYSFSHPQDQERAPEGYQTVTVSSHTKIEKWSKLKDNEQYLIEKRKIQEEIMSNFKASFENYGIEEIDKVEIGTPHTFEKFTRRHKGLVGGLPHNLKNNIFTFPSQETPIENFYQIGDTTFPGQGIVGVTTGSLILAGKILGKNFLKGH